MSETLVSKEQRTRDLWVLLKRLQLVVGTKKPTESPPRVAAGQWIKEAIVRPTSQTGNNKNKTDFVGKRKEKYVWFLCCYV